MRWKRGVFRFEEAMDDDEGLDPLDLPALTAEVFELMLRRSGPTTGSTREYLSHPQAWPLAGFYDEAILHLVVRTAPVGGTPKVYLYFEDSSDGTNWYIIDTQTLNNPADGVYRYVIPRPFAAWMRIRMVIEKTAGGAGLAALVLCRGVVSLKEKERQASVAHAWSTTTALHPELAALLAPEVVASSASPPPRATHLPATASRPAPAHPAAVSCAGACGGTCGGGGGQACGCG